MTFPPPPPPTLFDDLLRLPESTGGGPITTPGDWAIKRADIERRYLELLGRPPPGRPAAIPRVLEERDEGPFLRRKIAYAVEEDEEAEAWLLIPHGLQGSASTALCLHGTTRDGKDAYTGLTGEPEKSYARDLALRGFVTLTPDHFCTGARTPAEGHYDTSAFYRKHPEWSAVGKAIWDAQAALDVLEALPEVDRARIGCIGYSLGGHGTFSLAALEGRIAVAVSNCGITTWRADTRRLVWSRDAGYIYFPTLRPRFLGEPADFRAGAPIDMPEIVALIAPRPFLDISALNDVVFGAEASVHLRDAWWKLSELYELLGAPERFAHLTHRSGHSFRPFARACAYAWLEQHLGVA